MQIMFNWIAHIQCIIKKVHIAIFSLRIVFHFIFSMPSFTQLNYEKMIFFLRGNCPCPTSLQYQTILWDMILNDCSNVICVHKTIWFDWFLGCCRYFSENELIHKLEHESLIFIVVVVACCKVRTLEGSWSYVGGAPNRVLTSYLSQIYSSCRASSKEEAALEQYIFHYNFWVFIKQHNKVLTNSFDLKIWFFSFNLVHCHHDTITKAFQLN